jgi:hypothetical protein
VSCGLSGRAKSCKDCPGGSGGIDTWCAGDCRPYPPTPLESLGLDAADYDISDDLDFDDTIEYDSNVENSGADAFFEFFDPNIEKIIEDDAGDVINEVKKFDTIRTLKTRGQICQSKLYTLIKFDFN